MNPALFPLLAFVAGVAIAIQAGMNSRLGVLLQNSFLAAGVVYLGSLLFTTLYLLLFSGTLPDKGTMNEVPLYLWFAGGLLSAFAISSMYWLIPRAGVGPMISFYLTGQLILSLVAGHYGWFHLPVTPVTPWNMVGAGFLFAGILLVQRG